MNALTCLKRCLLAVVPLLAISASLRANDLPTPASVLGFEPCAEKKLADYEQIVEYFQALDRASDRMQMVDVGVTAEGRTQWLAIISSEENMRQLDRFKEISGRLARARDVSDEQARQLASEGRAIIWIDFGLHSTELAHAQTAPWMAYKAVSEDTEEMRFIRDQVVFLLLVNMNPDGTSLVVDWYRKNLGTPFEDSRPPELYQKYVGHDNNRDFFMFNQPESRNIGRLLYREWYPQVIYNQHQSAPFPARIFHPPFEEPMNPNIPPLVMRGVNTGGRRDHAVVAWISEGKVGAVSRVGVRHLVERRHAHRTVLPQHGRHPHRDRPHVAEHDRVRRGEVSPHLLHRRLDQRAVDLLSAPLPGRTVALPRQL